MEERETIVALISKDYIKINEDVFVAKAETNNRYAILNFATGENTDYVYEYVTNIQNMLMAVNYDSTDKCIEVMSLITFNKVKLIILNGDSFDVKRIQLVPLYDARMLLIINNYNEKLIIDGVEYTDAIILINIEDGKVVVTTEYHKTHLSIADIHFPFSYIDQDGTYRAITNDLTDRTVDDAVKICYPEHKRINSSKKKYIIKSSDGKSMQLDYFGHYFSDNKNNIMYGER